MMEFGRPLSTSSLDVASASRSRPTKHILYLHGFGDTCGTEAGFVKDQLERAIAEPGVERMCFHAPSYHPNEDIAATRLVSFIDVDLVKLAGSLKSDAGTTASASTSNATHDDRNVLDGDMQIDQGSVPNLDGLDGNVAFSVVIGFSVGGYVASLFQERHPHLVDRVVLLAPAIDNYERNFQGKCSSSWYMPEAYVAELRDVLGSRPKIKVPAMLIHGERETDAGGSAPWRVKEWVEEQRRNASREDIRADSHEAEASKAVSQSRFHGVFYPPSQGHVLDMVGAEGESPTWIELARWALAEEK